MYNTYFLDAQSPARPDGCTEVHEDVTQRSCHPDYGRDSDFCLIRLNRPSVYKPAVLYDSAKITGNPDAYGKPVVIAGFGSFDGQARVADNLLKAEITVANTTRCLEKYEALDLSYGFDPALAICGNVSTGKDACVGDSGGPLFTKIDTDLVVIGVTARGADGCNTLQNLDGIYGRVNTKSFRDFANPILSTNQPTSKPTRVPTSKTPTKNPTDRPTKAPSQAPTQRPTTLTPTRKPSKSPTERPTKRPSSEPTVTRAPTKAPTRKPSKSPTERPTKRPSSEPTVKPTRRPTNQPSMKPTKVPTAAPTSRPSSEPTFRPTRRPTFQPSTRPTSGPTGAPTFAASCVNSTFP